MFVLCERVLVDLTKLKFHQHHHRHHQNHRSLQPRINRKFYFVICDCVESNNNNNQHQNNHPRIATFRYIDTYVYQQFIYNHFYILEDPKNF